MLLYSQVFSSWATIVDRYRRLMLLSVSPCFHFDPSEDRCMLCRAGIAYTRNRLNQTSRFVRSSRHDRERARERLQ